MKTIRDILIIALIGAALAGAYWMGRRSVAVETVETVRIDTVFYEKPAPVTVSRRSIAINVPRVLFAPAASTGSAGSTGSTESTGSAPVAPQKDSVRMELNFKPWNTPTAPTGRKSADRLSASMAQGSIGARLTTEQRCGSKCKRTENASP